MLRKLTLVQSCQYGIAPHGNLDAPWSAKPWICSEVFAYAKVVYPEAIGTVGHQTLLWHQLGWQLMDAVQRAQDFGSKQLDGTGHERHVAAVHWFFFENRGVTQEVAT